MPNDNCVAILLVQDFYKSILLLIMKLKKKKVGIVNSPIKLVINWQGRL